MNDKDIPNGQHFWAVIGGELIMIVKSLGRYYAAGNYEGTFKRSDFTILYLVDKPKGYEDAGFYYA